MHYAAYLLTPSRKVLCHDNLPIDSNIIDATAHNGEMGGRVAVDGKHYVARYVRRPDVTFSYLETWPPERLHGMIQIDLSDSVALFPDTVP